VKLILYFRRYSQRGLTLGKKFFPSDSSPILAKILFYVPKFPCLTKILLFSPKVRVLPKKAKNLNLIENKILLKMEIFFAFLLGNF